MGPFFEDIDLMALGLDGSGQPLMDSDGCQWSVILLCGGADMEGEVKWGMTSYNAAAEMCGRCLADRDAFPYSDTRVNAAWCSTSPLSDAVFLERIGRARHPLALCRQANIFLFPA